MKLSHLALAGIFALAGCNVSSGDDDEPGAASPETKALFGPLAPATGGRLRGVWGLTVQGNDYDVDVRFRFTEDRLVGGAHCRPKKGTAELTVGGSVPASTAELDGATGTYAMSQTLAFSTTAEDGSVCSAKLDAARWSFAITGTNLTMTSVEPRGSVSLQKLGD